MMREVVGVALFCLSVGVSAAGLLQIIAVGHVSGKRALVWTVVLALCWGAWYVVQGRML